MSGESGRREVGVLVHDGQVAVSPDGTVAELPPTALEGTFPMAPWLPVEGDVRLVVDVREAAEPSAHPAWCDVDDAAGAAGVLAAVRSAIRTYDGDEPLPPRREPWFVRSWRSEVEAWVDEQLAVVRGSVRTGPLVAVKVWNLSAVLRIPTADGDLLLKAACEHFRSEPRITDLLGRLLPGRVPSLVARDHDRGWLLMEPLEGVADEDDVPPGLAEPAARQLASMQLDCLPHTAELRAAGCPERGLEATMRAYRTVLESGPELHTLTPDQRRAAHAALPRIEAAHAELAAYEIPDTLVHGDLHLGNVAEHEGRVTVFDWSDASVGHPFLDLVHLRRHSPEAEREGVTAAYVERWRQSAPMPDPARALELAEVAEDVFLAVTYHHLAASLDRTDVNTQDFADVVPRKVLRASGLGPA